jgi:hypothetical protein
MLLRSSGYLEGPENGTFPGFSIERESSLLTAGKDVHGMIWPGHDQILQGLMSNLLMLKCSPWLAEMEKTAFKESDDGWMSGNASRVLSSPFLVDRKIQDARSRHFGLSSGA